MLSDAELAEWRDKASFSLHVNSMELRPMIAHIDELTAEVAALRLRLLSAAGDDLCRLTPEEIKRYSSGEVQIPPKEEFMPSCERFWEQTAARAGVLPGCLTLAQLIAENERLRAALEAKGGA